MTGGQTPLLVNANGSGAKHAGTWSQTQSWLHLNLNETRGRVNYKNGTFPPRGVQSQTEFFGYLSLFLQRRGVQMNLGRKTQLGCSSILPFSRPKPGLASRLTRDTKNVFVCV